ncbi:hypothetical protein GCM10010221_04600 [Streptomyces parvus]|nr:hypothetical protein GCM10010221_04600 [Streptomyces parvus]
MRVLPREYGVHRRERRIGDVPVVGGERRSEEAGTGLSGVSNHGTCAPSGATVIPNRSGPGRPDRVPPPVERPAGSTENGH